MPSNSSWKGAISLEYRYTAGVAGERFLNGLKAGRLLAAHCDRCGVTYLPPRMYCERCLSGLKRWSEVDRKGYLYSYTVTHPGRRPVVVGLAKFKGIEGGILAPISVAKKKLRIGTAVKISIKGGKVSLSL